MEVDTFLLADGAHAVGGKLYVLGGGWNTISVAEFPTTHQSSLALALRVAWEETNQRHTISVEQRTLEEEVVQQIVEMELETGRPPGLRPGASQPVTVAAGCAFNAEEEGESEYSIVLIIDGAEVRRIPLRIMPHRP